MKIRFRIGIEEGGPQPPAKQSPPDAKTRLLRPFTLLARTRDGSICEAGRSSGVLSLYPGGFSQTRLSLAPSASFQPALLTRKLPKIERFFAKWAPTSNRQWPANRCYRKQRIKPCLTGARTHIRDFGFLALSLLPPSTKKRATIHLSRQFNPPFASYVVGANLIPQRA